MIRVAGDNIITPLGTTTVQTLNAILQGESEMRLYEGVFGLPEPFFASLLKREDIEREFTDIFGDREDITFFERLAILSASKGIEKSGIDVGGNDVLIVLSTTKGNVSLLEHDLRSPEAYLSKSASVIARFLGNPNEPMVVSNACISGVCAQIYAVRELLSGRYRHAVVIGCDILSKFIISGFQSFKALSQEGCRPYDADRCGLNLGEGAATIVLTAQMREDKEDTGSWIYSGCSIHNDANHISGPSRTGEGAYRVLTDLMNCIDKNNLAMISGHGTATVYNDEMESIAITRAGLDEIPLCGVKGFLGHTLGAAGVIETILCMQALDRGLILPTKGFSSRGTSCRVNVSNETRSTSKREFIKILSGFGGCNAGIIYKKG